MKGEDVSPSDRSIDACASTLPLELKIAILTRLPYRDVKWVTSPVFWEEFWKVNFDREPSLDGRFKPNQEQEYVLDLIRQKKNVFINSPAGTGKSALLKHVKTTFDKVVGVTSTTGISALNIQGSTLHSFLGIGLGIDDFDDMYDKVNNNPVKKRLWKELDLLVIDEVSMLHPTLFKKLEKLARKIKGNKKPFGGVQLLMAGDLFQLPCVDTAHGTTLIVTSTTFNRCVDEVVELRNIMRQSDLGFKKILNKIRVGTVDDQVKTVMRSRFLKVPKDLAVKPTMLFCTKDSVEKLNDAMLDAMAAKGASFYEYVMDFQCTDSLLAFNYAKSVFCKNSTTPAKLQLTESAQVMLTYNLGSHLVNGSRGVVKSFEATTGYPVVEFVSGQTEVVQPVRFGLHSIVRGKMRIVGYAVQVPLRIAYALTVHSCQGATLDCVALDLSRTFEYGQVYTALSRTRSLEGLYIKRFNFDAIQAHPEALKFMDRQNT